MTEAERYELRQIASYALQLRGQAETLKTEVGRLSRQIDTLLAESTPMPKKRKWGLRGD